MRNPSNLMSALREDVNRKYRNSTKTQVDDRAMILPKMVDLKLRLVDEIKYTENGVLKTLSPTKDQVFFSATGLSWKYAKSTKVLKDNIDNESILINEHTYKLFQTRTSFVIQEPDDPNSANYSGLSEELGMEVLNPFFLFYIGEMIPWSCMRIISTLNNDYIVINNYDFPKGSGRKSTAVKNILDVVKTKKKLWCNKDAILGFECMQFYSPLVYIEAGYWAVPADYDSKVFDVNNMKLLFNIVDDFSWRCDNNLGTNHSFNELAYIDNNTYQVPREMDSDSKTFIQVFLPYSIYETPGMIINSTGFDYNYNPFSGSVYDKNFAVSTTDEDCNTLFHSGVLSQFSNTKDILNFKDVDPKNIILNPKNIFTNVSLRFGSEQLFHNIANTNKDVNSNSNTGYGKNPSLSMTSGNAYAKVLQLVGGISQTCDSDYVHNSGKFPYEMMDSAQSEQTLLNCINSDYAYPRYTGYSGSGIFDGTSFPNYGIDVEWTGLTTLYDIIFFDRHGSQNNVSNIDSIMENCRDLTLVYFLYENIRNVSNINDVTYASLTHDNISSNNFVNNSQTANKNMRNLTNTHYDTYNHNMTDDRFLAYTSLFDMRLLIDTIKEFTPIFQSTFYVSSKDHQFYKDMDSSGMSFTYRGENGEPNYLIEFINGKIPSDYDMTKYDANKFRFAPLTNVSTNGDTYEFIHFTNVHNKIYNEITSTQKSQGLSAIYNNFLDKNLFELEKTKILAYPIGDSSYANRELMVDTAGYQFYFDYPYDMTKNINIGFLLGWKQAEGNSSIIVLNNNGIIRYPVADNVYFDGTVYNVSSSIVSLVVAMFGSAVVGRAGAFAINSEGKIHAFTTIQNAKTKNTNELSHIFSIKDNTCTIKKIKDSDEYALTRYYDVKGLDDVGYLETLTYDADDETMYQYDIDTENYMVCSFTKDTMERVYLSSTITDEEKEALKNASYDFVYDFYGSRKYVNYDGEVTVAPITFKTYGCDFYFNPESGYPLLELDCDLVEGDNDLQWTIEPTDINYINQSVKIVPETQFRYSKIYIDMPRVSIDLPGDFQYCRDQNRYLVFLNGLLVDTANYRITSPRSDLPFTKVSLYMSITMDEGDYLEVFYLPHELYQVEYREYMVNNIGDIIVDFGDQPYLMQYLTADTCMVFVNGKKVPSTKIKNISMNRLSILASELTSIENLIVYSFIPFFPMVDYLAELNELRLEMINNPKQDNSLYQMTKMFNTALKANFTSVWDTIAFKIATNIILGGYNYAFDATTKDANMFDGAADDIAIVYEVIRDNYVSGIVTGVPFVYTYDDVIFDYQEDIVEDEVIMSDADGIKLINIYNAMLEHSYILDRDYQGYEVFLPSYSVETLGYDTVYIRYTESQLEQTANGLLIPELFNVLDNNGTNKYYINTELKGTNDGYVLGNTLWADSETKTK